MVLQQYLSSLILKYAKLYIKNIQADLQFNIWGGSDIILNNLELKLDIISKLLNVPNNINISRGYIKEY